MNIKKYFSRFEDRGPYTLNGFGTTYYGRRDFRADGSYLTTEWIVALYIPSIPIRSLRVSYAGRGEHRPSLGFGSSENYTVYEKRFPPDWKQVLFTYGYVALLVFWASFVGWIAYLHFPHAFGSAFGIVLVFIVCIIPVSIPWILWHFAEKKAYERHDA
jgi:hypothetical protein